MKIWYFDNLTNQIPNGLLSWDDIVGSQMRVQMVDFFIRKTYNTKISMLKTFLYWYIYICKASIRRSFAPILVPTLNKNEFHNL